MSAAHCPTCDEKVEVEPADDSETAGAVYCLTCGDEFVPEAERDSKYDNYVVGEVLDVSDIPKTQLKKVKVDIGDEKVKEAGGLDVVTNTKHVAKSWKVVVAVIGAVVPAGASTDDDDTIIVKKASVGGTASHGMLCDCVMLGWNGGAKGAALRMPDDTQVGTTPPSERPKNCPTK